MNEGIWQKRSRFLAQCLIFSLAINIAFFATFAYFLLRGRAEQSGVSLSKAKVEEKRHLETNSGILKQYCEKKFRELVELLKDKELLEEGYRKRDFALAILTAFHQFDTERALGGASLQKRQILFSIHAGAESTELFVFSNLSDEQYEAIIRFAVAERWPLTAEGLFFEIKRGANEGKPIDAKLIEAFCLSQEYLACTTLFRRSGIEIPQEELLRFLSEGDWASIKNTFELQKKGDLLSLDHLRNFLLQYLQKHSKRAAQILVAIDSEFTLKRLADEQILFVLDNIDLRDKRQFVFAKAILCSTRPERVIRIAAQKLYLHANEPFPQDFQILKAIQRFCPEALAAMPLPEKTKAVEPKASRGARTYVVMEGDSLWKIAKRQKVSVDRIIKANSLTTEKLKVGQELKIPE